MNQLYAEKYFKDENSKWLVLLHGFAGSIKMWRKQTEKLKKEYNLLIIDLPGHGKSKAYLHENNFKSFTEIGDIIVDKMKEEGVEKATFLCLSLGSLVFGGILNNHPEVVEGAVLCGAVAGVNKIVDIGIKILVKFIKYVPYMTLMKIASFVLLPKKTHKLTRRLFIFSAKSLGDLEFKSWCYLMVKDINILRSIKNFKKPVLFISGSEDYMFISKVKNKVSDLIKGSFKIINKCGHVCNIQKYDEVNDIILTWLHNELQFA